MRREAGYLLQCREYKSVSTYSILSMESRLKLLLYRPHRCSAFFTNPPHLPPSLVSDILYFVGVAVWLEYYAGSASVELMKFMKINTSCNSN